MGGGEEGETCEGNELARWRSGPDPVSHSWKTPLALMGEGAIWELVVKMSAAEGPSPSLSGGPSLKAGPVGRKDCLLAPAVPFLDCSGRLSGY